MRIAKSILSILLVAMMLVGCMMIPATAAADDGYYHGTVEQKTVWTPQSDGGEYTNHRIPGIVVSNKGTVLIYCEARRTNTKGTQGLAGDWSLMDVYVQRSEDGGKTFGDPIYICRGSMDDYATINNPVMIVGQDDTLHMLFCKDYSITGGGLWYTKSTDDGKTWSTPRKLENYASSSFQHDCFAFGPTHGICTSDGILMAPAWYVPKGAGRDGITSHGPSKAVIMYSKDNGETWKVADNSDQILSTGNEKAIAELSDGSIMLNGRSSPNRHIAVTREPLGRWTYTQSDPTLIDPGCCGGMAVADVAGLPRGLLYVGCDSTSYRTRVTLHCSFDDGWTWQGRTIMLSEDSKDNTTGGYCDVYVDNSNGKIYVLYERDWGKSVVLATVSYVDEFCTGFAAPGTLNEIVFDNKYALDAIDPEKTRNLNYSFTGSSLKLETVKSSASKKTQLDMDFISNFVNMDEHKYVLAKVKVDPGSDANAQLSAYFISGREQNPSDALKIDQVIPKDGQWYNLVLDLTPMNLKGVLHTVELRLTGENNDKNAMISMEIEALAFCKTEEEAKNYKFGQYQTEEPEKDDDDKADVTDTPATEAEETTAAQESKKGCGSVLGTGAALIGTFCAGGAILRRKKREE